MKASPKPKVAVAFGLVALVLSGAAILSPRTSFLGGIVRWIAGESGATQEVNDAADMIESEGWADDLEKLADDLTAEFQPVRENLPHAFIGGRLIPIDRLPAKYRKLGGRPTRHLEFVLGEGQWASRVMLSWAHLRFAVVIFAEPPQKLPKGHHVRRVGKRVFVIANES